MSGGGGQTSTTNNRPPQEYIDAYSNVLGRAQGVSQTPYEQYTGKLQADFSPAQQQAFNLIGSTPGMTAPYLNSASQHFTDASADLNPSFQPQSNQANQQYQQVANSNLPGAVAPWQSQAQQGFAGGARSIDPTQYSADAIKGFESPYTDSVVNATQNQFNTQNAQAQTQLSGNAASKGALGGDRLGVAQAQLAGQQQMAQAPVLANLRNQGFAQAQQEFNNQQQTNLGAQQNTAARQLQGAQGMMGLGSQSLTAAQQQAQLQQMAGQGFAGLGQMGLSAAQAQGWLNSQAGQGMAGLGNQALSNTLGEGSALLGIGGQQQQQAQTGLNIPYQQFQAQKAYPYQQVSYLSNIAQGLGSSSGGSGSSTTPGPSGISQAAGLGIAGVGLANQVGAFSGSAAPAAAGAVIPYSTGAYTAAASAGDSFIARGGRVGGFAGGGGVPDVSINGFGTGASPGEDITVDAANPDLLDNGIASGSTGQGLSALKRNYGSTTHTDVPHDSVFGTILKTAGEIAAAYYGGPAGAAAANAASSQVHFNRGGAAGRGFDGGGAVDDAPSQPVFNTDGLPPVYGRMPLPTGQAPQRHGNTIPKPPPLHKPEDFGAEAQGWVKDLKTTGALDSQPSNRGGSVPILSRGFAAGGGAPITVTSDIDAHGKAVPMMHVGPSAGANAGFAGQGASSDQLNAYLANNAAAAKHTPAPAPAAPAAAPAGPQPGSLTADQAVQIQQFLKDKAENDARMELPSGNGPMKRGGMIRGFDAGGDIGDTPVDDANESWFTRPGFKGLTGPDMGHVTNRPVGSTIADFWRDPNAPPQDPNAPGWLARHSGPLLTPDSVRAGLRAIGDFPSKVMENTRGFNQRFNRETAPSTETDLSDPVPAGLPPKPEPARAAPEVTDPWAARGSGADVPDDRNPTPAGFGVDPTVRDLGSASISTQDAPAGGFDKPAPPPDSKQTVAPPARGPGPPPPPDSKTAEDRPAPPAAWAIDQRHYADTSQDPRAAGRSYDKPDPWAAVTQAGLAMMAGTSPHALTNIGAGGLFGMNQYVSAEKSAKELAAKVQDNMARLRETQSYHQALGGSRDLTAQASVTRANSAAATAAAKTLYYQHKMENPSLSSAQLRDRTMQDLQQTTNPATGLNYTAGEAYAFTGGLDTRAASQKERARHDDVTEQQGDERLRQTAEVIANSKAGKQAQEDLARTKLDEQTKTAIMNQATRTVAADFTGKKTIQGEVDALVKARTGLASPTQQPPTPAAPTKAPATLDAAKAAIAQGANRDAVIERVVNAGLDPAGL